MTEDEYEDMLARLSEILIPFFSDYIEQAYDTVSDALANVWQPGMDAREWLTAAGSRLGCDTSECDIV
jgi:hypothetical protein